MKRRNVSVGQQARDGRWYVNRWEDGRRRRTFFLTQREAKAEASRIRAELAGVGEVEFSMSAADRADILRFREECADAGVNWWDLLRAHREGRLSVLPSSPPLQQILDEMLASKDAAGRSHRYTQTLRIILNGFVRGREEMPLSRVTAGDVESWLASKNIASRPTLRARLSTLFRFAQRRGFIAANPCEKIEPVRLVRQTPMIFTVRQTAIALVWLRRKAPRALGWFVLSTLCGLRPEEAERTSWAAVRLDGGDTHIRVEAQTSKVRQRRIVTPLPAAVAWLKIAREHGAELPIGRQARRSVSRRLAQRLGWDEWPKDVTRHTAASYRLSLVGDAAHVAEQLGHTVSELKASYRALVTPSDAARFWQLIPRGARGADPRLT